jgi:chemotaxis protein CheD
MGELAVSGAEADVLTTIGLGSCVGLVMLDRERRTAGLAHVVFPKAPAGVEVGEPGKYADTAVPALVAAMVRLGSLRDALEAVLVGGARMFSFGRTPEIDIGSSNVNAVQLALADACVPIRATVTGGSIGRSVRVHLDEGSIALREAGVERRVYRSAAGRFEELVAG